MKLATTIGIVLPYTIDMLDAVRLCAKSEFKYLDYSFDTSERMRMLVSENWTGDFALTLSEAERHGMKFIQAHAPSFNPLANNIPYDVGMLMLNRSIEACSYLGIPNIVVHAGYSNEYLITRPEDYKSFCECAKNFYCALLPALEKFNVTLLVENSAHANMGEKQFFFRGSELAEFIDEVGSEHIKACWDTGHANLDKSNQYDDIMALGDRLYGIHVHDNFSGKDNHLPPFIGSLDADGLMQGLIDSGYKGYFTFEASLLRYKRDKNPPPNMYNRGNGSLKHPSAALALATLNYLYATGKYMLESYGCFEE